MSNLHKNKTSYNQDLIVYFIGEYGERILNQFRHWRKRYPVLNKCSNVSMDLSSEEHLIHISGISDAIESCHESRPNVVCFVFDSSRHDTTLLARTMAERQPGAIRLCFSPNYSESMYRDMFNMVINTSFEGRDCTARVLLTIYNLFLGCGQMGNIQCLKYLFHAIDIADHHHFSRVGLAIQREKKNCYDLDKLVNDSIGSISESMEDDESIIGLLEMNPGINAISVTNDIIEKIECFTNTLTGLVMHLGLKRREIKLTLILIRSY